MAELQVPDYMINRPASITDLTESMMRMKESGQNQRLNEMKMAYLPQEQERANRMGSMQEKASSMDFDMKKQAALKNFATDIKSKVEATGIPETDPRFQSALQSIYQNYGPIISQITGKPFNPNEPVHWDSLKSVAGMTPREELAAKITEKQALDPYEHDFAPQTTPGGDVVFYDKKHPKGAPIQAQPYGEVAQPIAGQQPTQPSNGLVNIFQPTQQGQPIGFSPKSTQVAQEAQIQLSSEEQKAKQQQEAERNKADLALIQSEPEKLAGVSKAAINLQGLGENLNKYGEQVKADWLPTDNSIAYNARQVLGSNTVLNDITQANGQIMVDTIRSMKQDSGISPTQLMNTEKEWERQLAAATGQGTVESRKNAWEKLTRELHQTYNAYEKTRAEAYKHQKKQYKPLINPDILPGSKTIEMDTANMPIGQTGVLNGKKIRVIGQNEIEVID